LDVPTAKRLKKACFPMIARNNAAGQPAAVGFTTKDYHTRGEDDQYRDFCARVARARYGTGYATESIDAASRKRHATMAGLDAMPSGTAAASGGGMPGWGMAAAVPPPPFAPHAPTFGAAVGRGMPFAGGPRGAAGGGGGGGRGAPGPCYNCYQFGHRFTECRNPAVLRPAWANQPRGM
jgi:hypothetical protein